MFHLQSVEFYSNRQKFSLKLISTICSTDWVVLINFSKNVTGNQWYFTEKTVKLWNLLSTAVTILLFFSGIPLIDGKVFTDVKKY